MNESASSGPGPANVPRYDAVKRAEQIAKIVCRGNQRKYYRFRPAPFYGGIATADCVGCCLDCVFCWSSRQVSHPGKFGRFYSPQQVANRLESIARKKGFQQVRISGNEPTIGREHLLKAIELVPQDLLFILETNGILIGNEPDYAVELSRFPNLHVRVGLKGACEEDFARLTGAHPAGFALQLAALENLSRVGVVAHPAVMVSFSSDEDLQTLCNRLAKISPHFADFEVEELMFYGDVRQRLARAGIDSDNVQEPGEPGTNC